MKLKDIQKTFRQELEAMYPEEEVGAFFYVLVESFYNLTRVQLAMDPELAVKDLEPILNALELLKQHKPIQYILGETEFYSLPFKVNEHTLIPRPETEELVEWVISKLSIQHSELKILDVGTGSGCIAISLAKNLPNAKVYALDVSKEALEVAKQNAKLNNVKVAFFEADILKVEAGRQQIEENWDLEFNNLKFDAIVSNPPYVRDKEKKFMKPNVLDNEPHLALFVKDDNPLQFYQAITKFAVNHLSEKGMLFFEINEYLGNDMMALLTKNNFKNIVLKQDMFKKDRMIKGEKI